MPTTLPDSLSIRETSKYLRIPLRSMYKLAQEGKVPCQKVEGHWQFSKVALDRWLGLMRRNASEIEKAG